MQPRPVQVAVIGKGVADDELEGYAEDVGRRLAEEGARVVCGGLGGVMSAVARGASQAGGDVIGIVPTEEPEQANEHCTHVVAAGVGYARNLAVVASADVVIAIGGEWGTLSEIGHARQFGRPVVALASWTLTAGGEIPGGLGIEVADDPGGAVRLALATAAERRAARAER
ncbi:MAG TPA: TIGR00725 family protein [Solirubrobacterales bacterium]